MIASEVSSKAGGDDDLTEEKNSDADGEQSSRHNLDDYDGFYIGLLARLFAVSFRPTQPLIRTKSFLPKSNPTNINSDLSRRSQCSPRCCQDNPLS